MARTRRRAYPRQSTTEERPDRKFGARGNARGKRHTGSKGQSGKGAQLPNKPRRG